MALSWRRRVVSAVPREESTGVRGFGGDTSGIVQTNLGTGCCLTTGVNATTCQILR